MAVKRYDGTAWQVVAGKGDQGTSSSISTWVKTATGGETSVSGNDDNSQPLSYTVGQELVFINGALQKRGADYTATTGNSITGLTALAANDVVTVWTVNAFSVTNAISNTLVDAKGDLVTASGADVPARLAVGSNGQVLTADSTTGTGLKWATPATPSFKGCRVFSTTNQTISNTTYTSITYNSESYDTDGFHSTSTNTSRITIPAGLGGYYLITGRLVFVANSTGVRVMRFMINGTTGYVKAIAPAISGDDTSVAMTEILNLSAGDYIELQAYQNSGGNLSTNQDSSSFLGMAVQYLGA